MNIKKILADITTSKAIAKGTQTIIKLGGESIKCDVILEGEKERAKIEVTIVECVDNNVFRRINNIYDIPYVPDHPLIISDVITRYEEYLVDYVVEYVDSNNKPVVWEEKEQKPIHSK